MQINLVINHTHQLNGSNILLVNMKTLKITPLTQISVFCQWYFVKKSALKPSSWSSPTSATRPDAKGKLAQFAGGIATILLRVEKELGGSRTGTRILKLTKKRTSRFLAWLKSSITAILKISTLSVAKNRGFNTSPISLGPSKRIDESSELQLSLEFDYKEQKRLQAWQIERWESSLKFSEQKQKQSCTSFLIRNILKLWIVTKMVDGLLFYFIDLNIYGYLKVSNMIVKSWLDMLLLDGDWISHQNYLLANKANHHIVQILPIGNFISSIRMVLSFVWNNV